MKSSKRIFTIIIICLLISIGIILTLKRDLINEKPQQNDIRYEDHIQYYYGVSKYLNILSRCNREPNQQFVSDLKNDYTNILKRIDLDTITATDLVRVIYVNAALKIDNKEYLSRLNDYYDRENRIISNYPIKEIVKENYSYEYNASNTIDFWDQLINSGIDISAFNLEKGLVDFYYRTDDENKREQIIEKFIVNNIDMDLDYSLVKKYYEEYYNKILELFEEYNSGKRKLSFDYDIGTMTYLKACNKMGIDVKKGMEEYSKCKLTINDEGFDMITGNGDVGCVLMSSWLWDDLVNDTGLIVANEEFWNKLDELYTNNYYNEVRSEVLKDIEG